MHGMLGIETFLSLPYVAARRVPGFRHHEILRIQAILGMFTSKVLVAFDPKPRHFTVRT